MFLDRKPSAKAKFEQAAMPHLEALYGAALRLCRNPADAEDLLQEAMLRGFRFFNTFQEGTNCKAWLFRILMNVFRNRYREQERESEILAEVQSSDANRDVFVGSREMAGPDVESVLLSKMVSPQVERALEAVPVDFRMAVVLADLEDFSYKEIAEIMQCPAGTVMSRLYRGRRMLQQLLKQYAAEQGIIKEGWTESGAAPSSDQPVDLNVYRKRRGSVEP